MLFPFGLSHCQITTTHIIAMLRQSILVGFLVIKFYVGVPSASVGVLVPGHFYTDYAITSAQELSQIIFSAFIRKATEKCLIVDFRFGLFLLWLLFAHQQSLYN